MSGHELVVDFDDRKIDRLMAAIDQCHLPGAAIGVAIRGSPVYRKGFGLANMEAPTLLTPTTRMRVFSVTKHMTALTFLLLCEESRAQWDDCVGDYLPELHPVTRTVKLRELMGNTGGIRDVFDLTWQLNGPGACVSSAELLALYKGIGDVNAAPGSVWIYNNGGFLILTAAIERITGEPLEQVLRERLLERVGMYSSLLRRCDTDFLSNSATLHMTNATGDFEKSYLGTAWSGEAGMVSTVDDMLRWLHHMEEPTFGRPSTWAALKSSQRLTNGARTDYGLGLMIGRYRGADVLFHPGGGMGGSAQMLKVPAVGLDVIVMVNREDVSARLLADQILDSCLIGLDPIRPLSGHPIAPCVFRSLATDRVVQLFGKDGQPMVSIDGMDMPVEADEDGVLSPIGDFRYVKQTITLHPHTRPSAILLNDFGTRDELVLATPAENSPGRAIVGRYRSAGIGTAADVFTAAGGLRLKTMGRFGSAEYMLESLADRMWRARSTKAGWLGGILLFDHKAQAFSFSTYRSRRLKFQRTHECGDA